MTTQCDETCAAFACEACGEHVHASDVNHWEHWCEPTMRRATAARVAAFVEKLNAATATISPTGVVHDVQCPTVRAHLTAGQTVWAYVNWRPWQTVRDSTAVGKSCRSCSPPVTIQAKPRRLFIKLTGIGWPDEDGRCPKGHLPRWAKEAN